MNYVISFRVKRFIAVIFALVLIMAIVFSPISTINVQATGDVYYVDGTYGLDTNNGTSLSNAFRTIQRAANLMVAGDTCYIRGGTYREIVRPENSGTGSSPIIFQAYNDEIVTVSGTNLLNTTWTQHSGNIYKTDVKLNLSSNKLWIYFI